MPGGLNPFSKINLLSSLCKMCTYFTLFSKFLCSSTLPDIKYNCALLLLSQLLWLFIYASKDIFSQTTTVESSQI